MWDTLAKLGQMAPMKEANALKMPQTPAQCARGPVEHPPPEAGTVLLVDWLDEVEKGAASGITLVKLVVVAVVKATVKAGSGATVGATP